MQGKPLPVNERTSGSSDVSDPEWVNPKVTLPTPATVEVDVPAEGWARAGDTPVAVARPASGAAPDRLRVRVLSQAEVERAGGRLLGIEVSRADGSSAPALVAVSLDYAGIAKAYGGDFASRLRLVHARECSPSTVCSRRSFAARNDTTAHKIIAREVAVGPDPQAATPSGETVATAPEPTSGFGPQTDGGGDPETYADTPLTTSTTMVASSSSSGANGDYAASALSGADRWDVGIGSGAFTYSYPISVPPAVAGAAPSLSLNYSSQSVDGRTVAANGQAPKVGEGWSFEPGFIERKFKACGGSGANKADLCWSPDNEYILSFGGRTAELIRKPGTDDWRIRGNDPAWRIRIYAGSDPTRNADNNGEWFQLVTPDGTKYSFGYGIEANNVGTTYTSSAFEVPVYGDDQGEPCHSAVLANSWCHQAYRWNLDRVADTNGNVTTFFYTKERNYYSRQATSALATRYVRAGYLRKVEYSQRNGSEGDTAHSRVLVTTYARCNSEPMSSCAADPLKNSDPTKYPDVPLDLMCEATQCPTTNDSPTFWSTRAIGKIETEFWHAAPDTPLYELVSTYDLAYSFPVTGDGTSPSLWLKSITHTGEYGEGSTALPPVRFYGVAEPNRVNSGPGVPELYKYRIDGINNELGAQLTITYRQPHPCPEDTVIAWNSNPYDCFPAWYDPNDGTTPGWVAFHKYLVTKTVLSDERGGQPARTTAYTYEDTPAWHYGDSLLNKDNQSWTDYRGHSKVEVAVAGSGSSNGTKTRYVLFRGMYGDKLTATTSKTDTVKDSLPTTFNDLEYRAGLPLEVLRYDASDAHVESTLYRNWTQQTIDGPDGFQSHDTQYVRESRRLRRVKNTATGLWRQHDVDMTYSATYGTLQSTSDSGTSGVTYDNTCTKVGYAENDTAWIINAPYRTTGYDSLCGGGGGVISQAELWYDGNTADLFAPPAKGNVTQTRNYSDATTASVAKTGYDAYGRVTSVMRPQEVANGTNGATTTVYEPATGYPHDGITSTTPPPTTVPGATGHSTKTLLWFAWGTPRRVTDVGNGDTTTYSVDHLGRTTEVTRPMDPAGKPSATFKYDLVVGGHNKVTTSRLLTDQSYVTTYDFVDGLGRTVQTHQSPPNDGDTGSRVMTTRYDSLGQVAAESEPFAMTQAPGTYLADINDLDLAKIQRETRYGYDALGRVYRTARYSYDVSKYATDVTHTGWTRTVHGRTRGAGDSPALNDVDYHHDVFGRITKVVNYNDAGSAVATSYAYTPLGDLDTVTDHAGNTTNYGYDWLRRRTTAADPNLGTWTTVYDADGNVKTTRDAEQQTILYTYDRLGRRTRLSTKESDAAPETLVARWDFDGIGASGNGVGRLSSVTTIDPDTDAAYVETIGGYDDRGRVSSRKWTIPRISGDTASRAAVAGDYEFAYQYNLADMPTEVTLPAVPRVPALNSSETVVLTYNRVGLPFGVHDKGTGGASGQTYLSSTSYFNNGEVKYRTMLGGSIQRDFTYHPASGHILTSRAYQANATKSPVYEDVAYAYDSDRNVTAVTDNGTGGDPQRECFRHDKMNRLVAAFTTLPTTACSTLTASTEGPNPYSVEYTYDDLGNMTGVVTKDPAGQGPDTTTTYTYGDPLHPHAVSKVWSGSLPTNATHIYDKNGATTTRTTASGVVQTLEWTPLHRLESVSGADADVASFVYDADGDRLVRNTGNTATLYLDGIEVTATSTTNNGVTSVATRATRYYGSYAMRTAGDKDASSTISALLRNHQNSGTTQITGDIVARLRYTPYGARRGVGRFAGTDRAFLDKTEDATGLIAVGARYYDPSLGRFVSVDPLSLPYEPQGLASYSYAGNNPTTFSDPSGLVKMGGEDGGGGSCTDNDCSPDPEPDPHNGPTRANPPPAPQSESDEARRAIIENVVRGVVSDDSLFGKLDEAQRTQVLNAFLASPCSIAGGRQECQGNSHFLIICQLSGWGGCAARAEESALKGQDAAAAIFSMAGFSPKIASAAGARFKARGAAKTVQGPARSTDDLLMSFRALSAGKQKHVKTVASETELRQTFDAWTVGAQRLQARGPKVPEVYQLPDGTVIQWRTTSDSGGPTIDIFTAAGRPRRVHVE